MVIFYGSEELRKICQEARKAVLALGSAGAKKLHARLSDLDAAARVTDLRAGGPHPLTRDLAGHFAVGLDGGRRMVFCPEHDPVPTRTDGTIDWSCVTAVRITFIGDYHG